MDASMYALDVAVAIVLAGLMIAYNTHKRKAIEDLRVEDVFDSRRYFLIANIVTVVYALIAIGGLSISVFYFPPAHWVTMILLGAFAAVDLVRTLFRVRSLQLRARQENSASAAAVAPEVRSAGLWMLLYTALEIANLFYFI